LKYFYLITIFILPHYIFGQPELLKEVNAKIDLKHPQENGYHIIKSQIYRYDLTALQKKTIIFPFFEESLTVDISHKERHLKKSTSWIGRINGEKFSYTVFSKTDDVLYGKIWREDGRHFLLLPLQSHIVRLVEVAPSNLTCSVNDVNNNSEKHNQLSDLCKDEPPCTHPVIDMMSVYTPTAGKDIGLNKTQIQAGIVASITEMNAVNQNSEAQFSLRLIYAEEIDYTESNSSEEDFNFFQNKNDGVLDEVFEIRDEVGADLINMLVNFYGVPRANINRSAFRFWDSFCHSIVPALYMFNQFLMSHEIGHNLGLMHDEYGNEIDGISDLTACRGMEGYINYKGLATDDDDRHWRSVMAYGAYCFSEADTTLCPPIPFYSNADLSFGFSDIKDPLGIPFTEPDPVNGTYFIKRTACLVADWREANINYDDWVLDPDSVIYLNTNFESETNKIQFQYNSNELLINYTANYNFKNIQMFSISGKSILIRQFQSSKIDIPIKQLSKGLYVILLTDEKQENSISKKIIIH